MKNITSYIVEEFEKNDIVTLPKGEFVFDSFEIPSNKTLVVDKGTTINANPDINSYDFIGYNHNEMGDVTSMIYSLDNENITIKGEGIINLNGESFYHMDKPSLVESIGPEITQKHLDEAPRTFDKRVNQPIFFKGCTNVKITGVTIKNSPCWTCSFIECEDIFVSDILIKNSLVLPNNDGLHFCSSKNMIIDNCNITAGDDCIAFSSITNWDIACENAVVQNCIFKSASKAVSVGYMHSIVRNITISNVVVKKSNRAFVSMANPGTGLVENINVSNCIFEGRAYGGNWWGNGEAIVLMTTPHNNEAYRDPQPENRFSYSMNNINFNNVSCIAPRPNAVISHEGIVKNIKFTNVSYFKVDDELVSLKGNYIDLAPAPNNYEVQGSEDLVIENAEVIIK